MMTVAYYQIVRVLWKSDTIPGHRESRNQTYTCGCKYSITLIPQYIFGSMINIVEFLLTLPSNDTHNFRFASIGSSCQFKYNGSIEGKTKSSENVGSCCCDVCKLLFSRTRTQYFTVQTLATALLR